MSQPEGELEPKIPETLSPELIGMLGELASLPPLYQNTVLNTICDESQLALEAAGISRISSEKHFVFDDAPAAVAGYEVTERGQAVMNLAASTGIMDSFIFDE